MYYYYFDTVYLNSVKSKKKIESHKKGGTHISRCSITKKSERINTRPGFGTAFRRINNSMRKYLINLLNSQQRISHESYTFIKSKPFFASFKTFIVRRVCLASHAFGSIKSFLLTTVSIDLSLERLLFRFHPLSL